MRGSTSSRESACIVLSGGKLATARTRGERDVPSCWGGDRHWCGGRRSALLLLSSHRRGGGRRSEGTCASSWTRGSRCWEGIQGLRSGGNEGHRERTAVGYGSAVTSGLGDERREEGGKNELELGNGAISFNATLKDKASDELVCLGCRVLIDDEAEGGDPVLSERRLQRARSISYTIPKKESSQNAPERPPHSSHTPVPRPGPRTPAPPRSRSPSASHSAPPSSHAPSPSPAPTVSPLPACFARPAPTVSAPPHGASAQPGSTRR